MIRNMPAMLVWFLIVVSAGVGTNGFSPSFSDATRGTPRPHEHGVLRASAVELGCARLARLGSRADWSRLSHAALLAALDDLFDGLCVGVPSAQTSTTHAGVSTAAAAVATGKLRLQLRREAKGLGVRNVMGEDTLGGLSKAESKTKLRALHYIDQSAHARARAWLHPDPRRARARVRARARARGPKAGLQLDESADQHRPDQGQPSSPQLVPDRYPSHGHGPAHVTEPTPVRVTSTPGRLELAVDDWPGEREALEAVFNSTGGQTWAQNDYWTSANVSVCAWFGVKCTSGRVSTLNLTGNGLVGEVPPFTLGHLVVLDFSRNSLTGIAADALASLPLLESLYV